MRARQNKLRANHRGRERNSPSIGMKHRAGGKNHGVVVDAERLVKRRYERMKN
jgi:hypothetical protein